MGNFIFMQKIFSFKYRIYPNNVQKNKIDNNISCARFIYNQLLSSRIYEYGKYLQYKKRCKKIGLKQSPKTYYSFFEELVLVFEIPISIVCIIYQIIYFKIIRKKL